MGEGRREGPEGGKIIEGGGRMEGWGGGEVWARGEGGGERGEGLGE